MVRRRRSWLRRGTLGALCLMGALSLLGSDGADAPGHFSPSTATQWADRLLSTNRVERKKAFRELAAAKEKAVPVLMALMRSPVQATREHAANLFSRLGAPAVTYAVELMSDEQAGTRYDAVCILRNLGPDAKGGVLALARALFDERRHVAMEAGRALATIGPAAAPAVSALASTLSHPEKYVRVMAAGALASIGSASEPATPSLIEALKDEASSVRRCAADALAAIGPKARLAVPALVRTLSDPNVFVRTCAAGALGAIGPGAKEALPVLKQVAQETALRSEVEWAIARITGKPRPQRAPDDSKTVLPIQLNEKRDEWTMFAGTPFRNAVSDAKKIPLKFNLETGENIRWVEVLGETTYGS
ncbi:MAG: HEAT repeat domain-containing protein, partial [Planctomycetota bacterium]